jgi:hypothetical protein
MLNAGPRPIHGPQSWAHKPRRERATTTPACGSRQSGGRRRSIEITNYSVEGLSVDRAAGIELDERVTIELRSGERLPMRVVWIKGGEAGVRFLAAIAREHTVMRSLDKAAKNYKLRRHARAGQHSGQGRAEGISVRATASMAQARNAGCALRYVRRVSRP